MAEKNIVVKFVRDHEVQDEHRGTEKATAYKKGQRKALPTASAQHFVDRGIAEYAQKPAKRAASKG